MADDENWRLEMRKTIEGFLVRLDEMMAQWRKNDVNGIKQEMENEAVEEAKIEDIENDIEELKLTLTLTLKKLKSKWVFKLPWTQK